LTACRRTEIGSLSWPEIALERRLIELPGERVKNSTNHLLPLSEPALAILEGTPQGRREECCIFGQDRSAEGLDGWAKSKLALDKRIAKAPRRQTTGRAISQDGRTGEPRPNLAKRNLAQRRAAAVMLKAARHPSCRVAKRRPTQTFSGGMGQMMVRQLSALGD
jgi:integrase